MADKRESNKLYEEVHNIRKVILERKLDHLRHLTYDEVQAILNIHKESNEHSDGDKASYTIKPSRPVTEKKRSIGNLTVDIDCSEALKGIKAITREAKNATAALKELDEVRRETKLLLIELDTEVAIPKIFYEGKRIEHLVDVELNWRTKTDKPGYTRLKVDHYKENGLGYPELNRIGISK